MNIFNVAQMSGVTDAQRACFGFGELQANCAVKSYRTVLRKTELKLFDRGLPHLCHLLQIMSYSSFGLNEDVILRSKTTETFDEYQNKVERKNGFRQNSPFDIAFKMTEIKVFLSFQNFAV